MNKPCTIHFHTDSAPLKRYLPERYQPNVILQGNAGEALAIAVQNGFLIDFSPEILRTRVAGQKIEDPVDFPLSAISFIEWHYGEKVPEPLTAEPHQKRNDH